MVIMEVIIIKKIELLVKETRYLLYLRVDSSDKTRFSFTVICFLRLFYLRKMSITDQNLQKLFFPGFIL